MPPEPARFPTILQVLPALDAGGVERGTIEIAQAIAGAGGKPLVASQGGRLVGAISRAGGTHFTLKLASRNPLRILRNQAALESIAKTHAVRIIHARSRAPAWSAYRAARQLRLPFVTTWHGTYRENLPFKRAYNAVMAKGDLVIAISHYIAAELMRRHAVPANRVRVIPRGVDPAVFDPAAVSGERIARLAQAWRLPESAPVILLAGRLTRWKGQDIAIQALARLTDSTACLVLAGASQGKGSFTQELAQRATSLGLGPRVRIVGDCADMPAALALADVALNVSTVPEGFGRTAIEAQAMARPLIATNHGGAAETVHDGQTGFLIPPNDVAALTAALETALSLTPEQRWTLGYRARAHVSAAYTKAAMQAATLAVYAELAGMI